MGLLLRPFFFLTSKYIPVMKRSVPARQAIRARYLSNFLLDLKKRHHHIFAMLEHMPPVAFRILADDISQEQPERMSFHPRTTYFSIKYRTYLFKEEWGTLAPDMDEIEIPFNGIGQTVCSMPEQLEMIVDEFDGILAYFMREAIFEGRPFSMSQDDCDEFGITPADAEALEPSVIDCNQRIRDEFKEDRKRLDEILKCADTVAKRKSHLWRVFK